jgi:hypothetical protein
MHAKPSIGRFDLRKVSCSGWVIAADYEVLGLASDLCHYFGKLVLSFIS